MPAPRKYDTETRERAVRMYRDLIREIGDSKLGVDLHPAGLAVVGQELGVRESRADRQEGVAPAHRLVAGPGA